MADRSVAESKAVEEYPSKEILDTLLALNSQRLADLEVYRDIKDLDKKDIEDQINKVTALQLSTIKQIERAQLQPFHEKVLQKIWESLVEAGLGER